MGFRSVWHRHPGVRTGDELTLGERAADRLRHGMGSWAFVFGGAGRMKCSVIQMATRRISTNDPYVSARSRHETCEILKRGMKDLGNSASS